MKKPKISINAGAVIIVDGHKFTCTGTNEKTQQTPEEVIKTIQDCIKSSIAGSSSKKSRK